MPRRNQVGRPPSSARRLAMCAAQMEETVGPRANWTRQAPAHRAGSARWARSRFV